MNRCDFQTIPTCTSKTPRPIPGRDQSSRLSSSPDALHHKTAVKAAVQYMEQHLDQPITLETVAKLTGFSPTYFCKLFKAEQGVNFKNFLKNLRIQRSMQLLAEGWAVYDIAPAVGYHDQSYLVKVFRKSLGITPGRFRKNETARMIQMSGDNLPTQ